MPARVRHALGVTIWIVNSVGSPRRLAPFARARVSLAVLALAAVVSACSSAHSRSQPASTGQPAAVAATSGALASVPPEAQKCAARGSVRVATERALKHAVAAARPGERITLSPGRYQGGVVIARSGTRTLPITLCGPRSAVLVGRGLGHGYAVHLEHAAWWRLEDFSVQDGQKGVVLDDSDDNLVSGLYVHEIGDEGIHLRSFSSFDVVRANVVRHTGLHESFFGEGIYVGSAHSNWCRYTDCRPDASDHDLIVGNNIADTTAENIDIKEGTTDGTIDANHLDGVGMVASAATAWINVKGNDWRIDRNIGRSTVGDGFQVHQVYPGWGLHDSFAGNVATVDGPGYGIYVQSRHLDAVVGCDNHVGGARSGRFNVPCVGR